MDENNNQEEKQESVVKKQLENAAKSGAKKTLKQGAKVAGKATVKVTKIIVTKIIAVISPVILPILAAIIAVVVLWTALSTFGKAIGKVFSDIKDFFTISDNGIEVQNAKLDEVIKQLAQEGIKLADLGLASEGTETVIDPDTMTEKEKKNLRKYLEIFIKAEAVTSNVARFSTGTQGIIKPYKTINSHTNSENVQNKSLSYTSYDNFMNMISSGDPSNYYTVDTSGNIIISSWSRTERDGDGDTYYSQQTVNINQVAQQSVIPARFFIDLCMITTNPEFVYALANQIVENKPDKNGQKMEISITMQEVLTVHEYTEEVSDGKRRNIYC